MGLTDREAYLELRARYVRLVVALRSTRNTNPETLEAIERILEPLAPKLCRAYAPLPTPQIEESERRERHAA